MKNLAMIIEAHNGNRPLVAAAIHNGHELRPEILELTTPSDEVRLREEDPFTAEWTSIADIQIIGVHSRFEVDLNRPRDKAVYVKPEDAWGLNLWKRMPSQEMISHSLKLYDAFYTKIYRIFTEMEERFGHFVVFDLHSYNHRRNGPNGEAADPEFNPEVNIGTGNLDRKYWTQIIDNFISDLSKYDFLDRHLDVRENVKFKGGYFSKWINEKFPQSACCITIEFKKFFMDEWTGIPDQKQLKEIHLALKSTVPGILKTLDEFKENYVHYI
jgi:N-formylglutamate amidohydrolase